MSFSLNVYVLDIRSVLRRVAVVNTVGANGETESASRRGQTGARPCMGLILTAYKTRIGKLLGALGAEDTAVVEDGVRRVHGL